MSAALITFDTYQPGTIMGSVTEAVDPAWLDAWCGLYPWDAPAHGEIPAAMYTALMMRAYLKVVSPRPPGNIHARQHTEFLSPAKLGESITTEVRCISKELRRERRYVDLEARARGEDGRALYVGRMSMIWAA